MYSVFKFSSSKDQSFGMETFLKCHLLAQRAALGARSAKAD